jgi:uncharacterized protein
MIKIKKEMKTILLFKRWMGVTIRSKKMKMPNMKRYLPYEALVADILAHEQVLHMKQFIQHRDVTCFDHSIHVSYYSYLVCKFLKLDVKSVARGALLHDFFLYDWHITKPHKGTHAFSHSVIALENADQHFHLNAVERDIIRKHMWPLTIRPPRFKESLIVSLTDKYCSILETINACNWKKP